MHRRFTPGERAPSSHWVGPRAGLDAVAKGKNSLPLWLMNPGRPVRSLDTLLSYPGSVCTKLWLET
jgi:hypothetical protein